MPLTYHRRAFLRFLAGSPHVAALGGIGAFAQNQAPEIADAISDPKEASTSWISRKPPAARGRPVWYQLYAPTRWAR